MHSTRRGAAEQEKHGSGAAETSFTALTFSFATCTAGGDTALWHPGAAGAEAGSAQCRGAAPYRCQAEPLSPLPRVYVPGLIRYLCPAAHYIPAL